MTDTLVREQGATRWARPGDYGGSIEPPKRNPNPPPGRYRPNPKRPKPAAKPKPGDRDYVPRHPRPARKAPPLPHGERGVPSVHRITTTPRAFADRLEPLAEFAKRTGRMLRPINRLDTVLRVADAIDVLAMPTRTEHKVPHPSYWREIGRCDTILPLVQYAARSGYSGPAPLGNECLSGQAITPLGGIQTAPYGNTRWGWWYDPPVGFNYSHGRSWQRISGTGSGTTPMYGDVMPAVAGVNPNIMRMLPSVAPEPAPELATEAKPMYEGRTITLNRTGNAPPSFRRSLPAKRRPPGRKEKQRKATGPLSLGVQLFQALDTVSELSEIVDALYSALPEDVQDKWNRKSRGLTDQAGQYGIDGADWKLEALWHNWHKIDPQTAVENIMNNVAQDAIHGLLHKNLPVNSGKAFDDGFKSIEKALEKHLYL